MDELDFVSASAELGLDMAEETNGALPWVLAPLEILEIYVWYAPTDDVADEAFLTVRSNDPIRPEAQADVRGQGAP